MSALSEMVMLGPAPSAYLLYDTFTGSSGNLSSHSMDVGAGWSVVNTWTIDGSGSAVGPSLNTSEAVAESGQGDVSASCTMQTAGASGDPGLAVRVAGGILSAGILAWWTTTAFTISVDGVSKATVSTTLAVNTNYTLTVLARGDYLVACVNGVYLTWITTTNQSNTKCGMYADGATYTSKYDDFKVIAAPAQTTYASDDFSEADGTNLSGKSSDTGGLVWTVNNGTWDVTSGQARQTITSGAYRFAWLNSGQSAVVITVDATTGTGNYVAGITPRFPVGGATWWSCQIDSFASMLYILETGAIRASVSKTWSNSTQYALKVVCAGNSIATSAGGVTCAYHLASALNTETRHGLVEYNGRCTFDNFLVKSL